MGTLGADEFLLTKPKQVSTGVGLPRVRTPLQGRPRLEARRTTVGSHHRAISDFSDSSPTSPHTTVVTQLTLCGCHLSLPLSRRDGEGSSLQRHAQQADARAAQELLDLASRQENKKSGTPQAHIRNAVLRVALAMLREPMS